MRDFITTQQNMIQDVNTGATNEILLLASVTDQRNMLARTSELINKKISSVLTDSEQDEFDSYQVVWGQIRTIRLNAQTRKAAINTATTLDELIEI